MSLSVCIDAVMLDMLQQKACLHSEGDTRSDAPEGHLARLVTRDEGVCRTSRQSAHAVIVAVQRIVGRRTEAAQPPAPN